MPSERVVSPGVSLKERIAALQQRNGSISPPNLSPPSKLGSNSLQGAGALRDKIARFEVKGGVPVPRGSFGLGAPPVREDAALRRKGELYGNRIVSANSGKTPSPSGTNKDGQLSLRTSDGSPVQRKRCISTSVLGSYISDTSTRSDSSSPSVFIDKDDTDSNTSSEDHSPILESPTRPCRRSSVSDVDAKRSSILADGSDFNAPQKRDSILWPSTPTRGQTTPPSPSRTITQELTDATVADESAAAIDSDVVLPEQSDELTEVQKEVPDADIDTDRRHDAHQEIFPDNVVVSTIDDLHVISSTAADEVPHVQEADKLDLNGPASVEERQAPESPIPVVEPAEPTPTTPPPPEPVEKSQEIVLAESVVTEEPSNLIDPSSPLVSPSSSEDSVADPSSQELKLPSPTEEPVTELHSSAEVEVTSVSPDAVYPPFKGTSSPLLHSQSMPAIVLNAPTLREEISSVGGSVSQVTRSSSLHRPRSPNPISLPPVPEQTYTELTLECTTGPKSFKAVVHGKKTHTKVPPPIDHHNQVVAPLNLRKGRSSTTRRQQAAVPTSPRTPNSPDLSLLVAQAAQLEQRLSGEPVVESIKEDDEGQEIELVQEVTVVQKTPNLEIDEFGRGPPISPSLQSLISNSSNDSKRRRSKSKSSKARLPAIDDMGVPPTPPPKSAHWFKTLPASILSRNPSMGSESTGDRLSRASWSSEKSSEDSSAITTPPSPTFDLVTLPLAEDQFHHPGYRLGGRRSSSISSSSVLSSPKKSPSKKLISRSSTFMSRMLSRAGKSNSTLALPDDSGSISDVPRASSPSPSHMSSSRSEYGLSTASPQLAAGISSRPTSTISTSSPASVLSSTIFDAFPAVPQEAPTPPPKSSLHFPVGNNPAPQSMSRSQSTLSKTSRREKISDPPSWYDEENGVHHSLLL